MQGRFSVRSQPQKNIQIYSPTRLLLTKNLLTKLSSRQIIQQFLTKQTVSVIVQGHFNFFTRFFLVIFQTEAQQQPKSCSKCDVLGFLSLNTLTPIILFFFAKTEPEPIKPTTGNFFRYCQILRFFERLR